MERNFIMYKTNGFVKLDRADVLDSGISKVNMQQFEDNLVRLDINIRGYMLLRHGKVISEKVWQPYDESDKVWVYSLSKSFTSTAVGIAVDDGLVKVTDKIVSFFPDKCPENPSDFLMDMSIHDLLCMSTGHLAEPEGDVFSDFIKGFMEYPVDKKPGTHFVYNSIATYVLSAIVEKVTGKSLIDFLGERLFEPLECDDVFWDRSPAGIVCGGWGLMIRLEDLAKLGQLYLDKGIYKGKRIISESWVSEATKLQSDNSNRPDEPIDWCQGYGYQFWMCRHGGFRGDGAFGQYIIVMPEQDMVLALMSEANKMAPVIDSVWKYILEDCDNINSDIEYSINNKKYILEKNSMGIGCATINFNHRNLIVELEYSGEKVAIEAGRGHWHESKTEIPFGYISAVPMMYYHNRPKAVSSSFHWVKPNILEIDIVFRETPHRDKVRFVFGGKHLAMTITKSAVSPFKERITEEIKGTY